MTIPLCRRLAWVLTLALLLACGTLAALLISGLREAELIRTLAKEGQQIGLRFQRDGAALVLELHSAALHLGGGAAAAPADQDQYGALYARSEAFFRQPPVPLNGEEAALLREVQRELRIYGEQVQAWLALPPQERLAAVSQADTPFRELLKDLQTVHDAFDARLARQAEDMRDSMSDLRWLILSAAGVIPCLLAVLAWLVQRGWLAPLQQKATSAAEAEKLRHEMTSLGSLAAGLAHEIRNPVGALKNRAYALGLLVDAEAHPKAAAQVASMNRELDRVERIVGDFLIYARPSAPHLAPCQLAALVDGFHHDHQQELQQRGVRFELGVVDEAAFTADPDLLRQALLNLVRNAAEACASQTDGRVLLEALVQERRIVFAVTDNGPGVPGDLRERLFMPFATLKRGGTGLGLTVSRTIIRQHGGDVVMAASTPEGTRFEIRLPRL